MGVADYTNSLETIQGASRRENRSSVLHPRFIPQLRPRFIPPLVDHQLNGGNCACYPLGERASAIFAWVTKRGKTGHATLSEEGNWRRPRFIPRLLCR